jgi:hypothetical protein
MALWQRGDLDSLTLGWQRTAVAAGVGEATWLASGVVTGKLCCSSGEDEGTKGAAVFGDPSWLVNLALAAAHRRGGELNTVARESIFAGQNLP